MSFEIRSPQNERVKHVVRLLRDATARREDGLTVVEGSREVARAVENGWVPAEVYIDAARIGAQACALALDVESRGIHLYRCDGDVFQKMSYRENPDGLLAVGPIAGGALDDLALPNDALVLVASGVEKPGNLGALLRTADGAGADAVIVCSPAPDLGNPNLIRASIGTIFYLPVVETTSDLAAAWLRKHGVRVVTTEPAVSLSYTEADLTGAIAIVVGAEDEGLPQEWKQGADLRVRIPMLGKNDSLNVSVAAAVLLYEAVRQRGSGRE